MKKIELNENIKTYREGKYDIPNHCYTFEFINNKNQRVIIKVTKTTHDLNYKHDLMNVWVKAGYITKKQRADTSINIETSTYLNNRDCVGYAYNPTVKYTKHRMIINFKNLYEWNENNIIKLVNKVYKMANKSIYDLNNPLFNFDQFDKFNDYNILGEKEYKALYRKAKSLYNKKALEHTYYGFDGSACFISSSALHGFYFPNINTSLRAIAFINKKAVIIYDTSK